MFYSMVIKIKEKKGVTMVETAAMLFFIFAFLGLMFTGGQMVANKTTLNYATQAAAREASVQLSQSRAVQVATEKATQTLKKNGIGNETIKVSVNPIGGWSKGNDLEVIVEANYKTLFPVPNSDGKTFSTNHNTMKSRIVVMIEGK